VRDRAFQLRPVYQRFLIVLAGPVANFLLAILIFASFFWLVGTPQTNIVGAISPNTAAATAGLQPGDKILSIAGRDTPTFDAIFNTVAVRPAETVPMTIERAGTVREITVTLGTGTLQDPSGQTFERGLLGVAPTTQVSSPVPIYEAVPMAVGYTARLTRAIVDGLVQLIRGRVSVKQLGGPIKIAQVAGQGASYGALPFVELLALLSINLGFINLLPVPMLDGGHLFFYAVEAVRRRPLSARAMEWAFRGGLAAILALLVFTTVNDLGGLGLW
jgi:regulator of sigma E protease